MMRASFRWYDVLGMLIPPPVITLFMDGKHTRSRFATPSRIGGNHKRAITCALVLLVRMHAETT